MAAWPEQDEALIVHRPQVPGDAAAMQHGAGGGFGGVQLGRGLGRRDGARRGVLQPGQQRPPLRRLGRAEIGGVAGQPRERAGKGECPPVRQPAQDRGEDFGGRRLRQARTDVARGHASLGRLRAMPGGEQAEHVLAERLYPAVGDDHGACLAQHLRPGFSVERASLIGRQAEAALEPCAFHLEARDRQQRGEALRRIVAFERGGHGFALVGAAPARREPADRSPGRRR